ncbi:hypothetical protein ONS95_001065 [Cadophora gregata]|uniref:uncharacterized protein n=1 Tax=Cadophora gregata TaxID=51156 RepID=UPI0026DA99AD|nr:uncharacterized protein ONS95_001065 [Cadophora gregata]KAK0102137.1 hypothetical protein ONS96_006101 [Cadophora gregata f. sp. sojae]KAK0129127.1 hypothetical protein ONS95_001065 [Cadophora gregata]
MTRPVPDGRRKPILPPTPSSGSGDREAERERVSIDATPRGMNRSTSGGLLVDVATKPTPESGPFIKSGGFFGPTNFSAVFMENRENLGNDEIQISVDSDLHVPSYESLQSQTFLMLAGKQHCGSPRVALGTKVLNAMPDEHTCKFLLEWYFEKCHESSYPKHSVLALANSFWNSSFAAAFNRETRNTDELEQVSTLLCKNAERALQEFEDFDDWLASCSGSNFRWESLGAVYGALTTSILSLPERDAFFATQRGDRRNRRDFAVEMKDCVQACITLSNYMDLINVPMVALLVKNLVLQTVLSGDASLIVWRQLGDLVSSSTALGLHRQIDTGRPPSYLSETKKRLFTVVFCFDKGSALLTGRPPALSYRYTRFELPLDLSEEVLVQGGEVLQEAVANLDENGWNKDGQIYNTTATRAHGMLAQVLNEVLELSLGDKDICTAEKIGYLMGRIQSIYNNLPSFYHFKLSDLGSPECNDRKFWRRLCLRLIMLEHRLLLERLAHKEGFLDGQSMVDCAREMLELTVLLWVQRDRFTEHHHDFDWMLMCWGVPSSGVLCVELLKQVKAPHSTKLVLPRSEIVQNLSLLIGFLEWVKPAAGNYQLCGRMKLIIKRILDQILNPGAAPPSSFPPISSQESNGTGIGTGTAVPGSQVGFVDTASVNGSTIGFDGSATGTVSGGGFDQQQQPPGQLLGFENDGDGFDWLNNVDWSRGPWFDLGQDFSAARWS